MNINQFLYKSSAPDFGDPFEGVFYWTKAEDLKTVIHFVSRVFYLRFRDKIVSDFSLTMDNDVIRCITHFRGLKCDMNIDTCASTVTVSGIGYNIWRDDFFPVVARLLFTQYVKFAESQVIESYTNGDADDRSKADECTNDPIRENHVPETM